jgi:hypothetical protein
VQGSCATLTQGQPGSDEIRVGVRIIEPAVAAFSITDASPIGVAGQDPNRGVTKIIIELGLVSAPVRLSVFFSPDATFPRLPNLLNLPLDQWGARGHP